MPASAPLIDVLELDLETVLHDKESIREACQQRGPLEMVDAIVHVDREANIAVGYKDIKADDWWTPFHIPGRPIFPGALMIEGCAQLCTFHYYSCQEDKDDTFFGFGGLNNTRFRDMVIPDSRLVYVVKNTRARRSFYAYDAQAYVGGKLVFETEIFGVIL